MLQLLDRGAHGTGAMVHQWHQPRRFRLEVTQTGLQFGPQRTAPHAMESKCGARIRLDLAISFRAINCVRIVLVGGLRRLCDVLLEVSQRVGHGSGKPLSLGRHLAQQLPLCNRFHQTVVDCDQQRMQQPLPAHSSIRTAPWSELSVTRSDDARVKISAWAPKWRFSASSRDWAR